MPPPQFNNYPQGPMMPPPPFAGPPPRGFPGPMMRGRFCTMKIGCIKQTSLFNL